MTDLSWFRRLRAGVALVGLVWACAFVLEGRAHGQRPSQQRPPLQGRVETGPDAASDGVTLPGLVEGAPCEDTSRGDQHYGTKAVRILKTAMVAYAGLFYRCGVDRCGGGKTAVCWPKRDWRERLKGPPGSDQINTEGIPGKVDGGPCEDTSKWDRQYGVRPIRIALDVMQKIPLLFFRCSVDRCAPYETALCWPRPNWKLLADQRERGMLTQDPQTDDPREAPGRRAEPQPQPPQIEPPTRTPPPQRPPGQRPPPAQPPPSIEPTRRGTPPSTEPSTPHRPPPAPPERTPPPRRPPGGGRGGGNGGNGDDSRDPLRGGTERVCDLLRLAMFVHARYNSDRPIATVRITNADRPTYLIALSGMQFGKLAQANTLGQAYAAWANMQAFDIYRLGILDAVADLPRGSDLIIVGHSQGGLEAMDITPGLVARGFRVRQVITYGAPITDRMPGTSYLHVRAKDDLVPLLFDRRVTTDPSEVLYSTHVPGADPHNSYHLQASGLDLWRVPTVSTLKTPCLEIDLTTLSEFQAPNFFSRLFNMPPPNPRPRTPINPGRADVPRDQEMNCFWAALAQDRLWATGFPRPARCETSPMRAEDIPPVLERWYKHKRLDDGHGPTPAAARARSASGIPVWHTTREGIENALPPGGRGLVFSWDEKHPDRIGHVFNVQRKATGEIEYFDGQQGYDSRYRFAPGYSYGFYRTQ